MKNPTPNRILAGGFALVITLALMVLLTLLVAGLLSLSAVSLRTVGQGAALAEARANARMALMLALGELQQEMGPDMRVSAEAAVFDRNPDTAAIEGVAQPHWLASYQSWGSWLNADYTLPDGGGKLKIQDTYDSGRRKMFRRWLLSLPQDKQRDVAAAVEPSGWDDSNSVVLVGKGSLGDVADRHPEQVTRAYLVRVGKTGREAWWIGPENHKARINLAKKPRTLAPDSWEAAQGDTAEVGVGALQGLEALDRDASLGAKLITPNTLRQAQVAADKVQGHFFDLTACSQGVLTSVRTGQLKKDLSLLFEKDGSNLPAPYKFSPASDIREPSIRPLSSELQAKNPTVPNRRFASWTNMRHFYRMYRSGSDATIGEIGGAGSLKWTGAKPFTDFVSSTSIGAQTPGWNGSNHYWRVPILAKVTFIYSLLSEPSASAPGKYDCYHVYTPVFTFWNPYNTEMHIPDGVISMLTSAYKIMPNSGELWLGDVVSKDANTLGGSGGPIGYGGVVTVSKLRSGTGGDIVFKPGGLKVFSHTARVTTGGDADLLPGFDPQAIGGEKKKYGTFSPSERPGLALEFSHSYWGGNVNLGNTGGAFALPWWWNRSTSPGGLPMTFSNDWFQRNPHNPDQTHTPMTPPGLANVARWVFGDTAPVPVACAQLAIKGLAEFDYASINWAKDWRCRNWIQAPPCYFGSGMYISQNDTIAHTQRLDCPYVTLFGPTSMAEMPKVVGHLGASAFLGSGSNPFEKITAAALLELPTAPIASLAGFSNMRINPGWLSADQLGSQLKVAAYTGNGITSPQASLYCAEVKEVTYQSGVTGPGIGNSFMHPMLPRTDVYRFIDNSKSQDTPDRNNWTVTETVDTKAYNDYWDHVFLLNDALWDDYFVSSLADQRRQGASSAVSTAWATSCAWPVSGKKWWIACWRAISACCTALGWIEV